jgi:hypothetical protein
VSPPKGNAFPYWPALPGRAATALQRPLPRSVRPVRDETLESYLWRLASANALNPHYFTMYVKGSKKPKAPHPAGRGAQAERPADGENIAWTVLRGTLARTALTMSRR